MRQNVFVTDLGSYLLRTKRSTSSSYPPTPTRTCYCKLISSHCTGQLLNRKDHRSEILTSVEQCHDLCFADGAIPIGFTHPIERVSHQRDGLRSLTNAYPYYSQLADAAAHLNERILQYHFQDKLFDQYC